MRAPIAASISAACFPTPEKTTCRSRFAAAARTRSSSPPETTSNPQPSFPSSFSTARFEFAFTE